MFKQMSDLKCGDLFRVYSVDSKLLCFVESYGKFGLFLATTTIGTIAICMGKMTEDHNQYVRVFANSKIFLLQSYYFNVSCEVL